MLTPSRTTADPRSAAQAKTARTRRPPTPVRRTAGATHIWMSETIAGSSMSRCRSSGKCPVAIPTRPPRSIATNVAQSGPLAPRLAASRHSASERRSASARVVPNACGESARARSRRSRRASHSSARTRRMSITLPRRDEVGPSFFGDDEADLVPGGRVRKGLAGDEDLGPAFDDRDLAGARDGALHLRARRDDTAAHPTPARVADLAGPVFDRHGDPVAERQPRFADRAGAVAPAHVDLVGTVADAHGDERVAARAVERDDHTTRRALPPLLDEGELFEVEHGVDTILAWRFVPSSSTSGTPSCSTGSRSRRLASSC